MASIGFAGLGRMGQPMALRLMQAGHDIIVHGRRPETLEPFRRGGARIARELSDLAAADTLLLCLPDGEIVERVLLDSETGLARAGTAVKFVADTSTISHRSTLAIARQLSARGIAYVDCPVSGMPARARDGTLTVMCGGSDEALAHLRPYLECLATRIIHLGGTGSGQLGKLVNQLLFDINAAALAEILPMASKMGLDPGKIGDIVNTGTGRSFASEFFIPRILCSDFNQGYSMANAYKDLVSAAELSASLCLPTPVLHAATTTYQIALRRGDGDLDKGAMIRIFEDLLGVAFRSSPQAGAQTS